MKAIHRKHGTGTIQMKFGSFYYTVRCQGHRKSFRLEAKSPQEAQKEADVILQQFHLLQQIETKEEIALFVGKAKRIFEQPTSKTFLTDGFKTYLQSISRPQCCEEFLKQKKVVWDNFVRFCSQASVFAVEDLTGELLTQYRSGLRKNRKPKTCNEHLCMVKQILRIMKAPADLLDELKPFPFVSEPMMYFNQEEQTQIMAAIDGEMDLSLPYRDEMKILFRILAWSGLRLKDACLFSWKSVNLNHDLIQVRPFKTSKSSAELITLPVHPDMKAALLRALPQQDKTGYVLPHVAQRYLANKSSLQHEIARTIDWTFWTDKKPNRRPPKAGKYGAHSFRHTFATFLMNNGVDPEIIAKMLGQKSLAITRIYMHLVPDTVRKIMNALPRLE